MGGFRLDERLANDAIPVGDLPLCRALLLNDARFPWLVLVPRRQGLVELHDLAAEDRAILIAEIAAASAALKSAVRADKINVGALGNIVRQLHVHVVARFEGDAAWPGPVWSSGAPMAYAPGEAAAFAARLRPLLNL